jgi:anti-sigma B factor antagonist
VARECAVEQPSGSLFPSQPDRRIIVNHATTVDPAPRLSARTTGGITVAELAGELDIASAPDLREQLLGLLRPGSGRLVIDLSKVSFCDASGLAVLVSTARRARLLGGFLRLAAVSPQVGRVLQLTGLHRNLATFPTVQAALTGLRATQHDKEGAAGRLAAGAHPWPVISHTGRARVLADAGELREAVADLLTSSDAWRNADPGRRFTPALRAMARARDTTDDIALEKAARFLMSALARHPLTHSPAVVATATRLRRVLSPAPRPVRT